MSNTHQVLQGPQTVKTGENLIYAVDIARWTSTTPTVSSVTVFQDRTGTDYTSTIIPSGSASVSGTIITLPEMVFPTSLPLGNYTVEVSFEAGGYSPGVFELPLIVVN